MKQSPSPKSYSHRICHPGGRCIGIRRMDAFAFISGVGTWLGSFAGTHHNLATFETQDY